MAIPEEDVAAVRSATDIVALIGEHTALRRQGRRWVGLCPFHGEKTPSFSVNAEEGLYYCFGCQVSGDAFTFVRETEHVDFLEAVRLLADRAGVAIREDRGEAVARKRRSELLDALERATAWYHERLLSASDAGPARDYLRSRGYNGEVVRQFRLGWAPDDWDALSRALTLPSKVLTDSGLGFVNRAGRLQDAFRARVMFPICDPSGHPVAFGGRVLPGRPSRDGGARSAPESHRPEPQRSEPKYKNSQETALYSKRRVLYGLNWAKKDVIATKEVVVCEGYTDVIGCFRVGVPRAVATCGTALAEEHFTLLRNFADRVVLAYDADAAGQAAIQRVYEWERKHQVTVLAAALPAGSDPGELARTDPEALRAAIEGARPLLEFRIAQSLASFDLTTSEGRARAAEPALAIVAEHPDELKRDQYLMQVSGPCRMDADAARARVAELRRRLQAGESIGAGGARQRSTDGRPGGSGSNAPPRYRGSPPGLEVLKMAVHHPALVADRLDEVLFTDEVQRQAFMALSSADTLHQAIDLATPEAADLLRRVAVDEPHIADKAEAVADPVDGVLVPLLRERARLALRELERDARAGDIAATYAPLREGQLWLDKLEDPASGSEAAERLVAWLLARKRDIG